MTIHRGVTKATFEFINRDGVPTKLIVTPPATDPVDVVVDVTNDGLGLFVNYEATLDNVSPTNWRYASGEDEEGVPTVVAVGTPTAKSELGPVARWSIGVVALAILAPFVAILWAWAGQVFRSFS